MLLNQISINFFFFLLVVTLAIILLHVYISHSVHYYYLLLQNFFPPDDNKRVLHSRTPLRKKIKKAVKGFGPQILNDNWLFFSTTQLVILCRLQSSYKTQYNKLKKITQQYIMAVSLYGGIFRFWHLKCQFPNKNDVYETMYIDVLVLSNLCLKLLVEYFPFLIFYVKLVDQWHDIFGLGRLGSRHSVVVQNLCHK